MNISVISLKDFAFLKGQNILVGLKASALAGCEMEPSGGFGVHV